MSDLKFFYDGNLGGCIEATESHPNGDPATYTPVTWEYMINTMKPASILDVGCGFGYSTEFFLSKFVEVLGIEGSKLVHEKISPSIQDRVVIHDFSGGPMKPAKRYDLAWCCEVLEHIDPENVDHILDTLCFADKIVLTHALPGQGGHHHVNCQLPSYWIKRFAERDYSLDAVSTKAIRTLSSFERPDSHLGRTGLVFRKQESPWSKKPTNILTYAAGEKFFDDPGFKAFVNSLAKSGFVGNTFIFTHDMPIDTRVFLGDLGIHVIDVCPTVIKSIVVDRFFFYSNFLLRLRPTDQAILLDSRDIVLQRNPCDNLPCCDLFLSGEGKTHAECDWNFRDQSSLRSAKDLSGDFSDWHVINGGVLGGKSRPLSEFCNAIWNDCKDFVGTYTDQATINHLYHTGAIRAKLLDPRQDLFAVHGDTMKRKVDIDPSPYAIFHQYDRTTSRALILEKFG